MKKRRNSFLVFLIYSVTCFSQEPPASQTQIFNDVKKYGYNPDGTAQVNVKGSQYWDDEWNAGQLFDSRDSSYGYYPVKIDIYSGLIFFRDRRGTEKAVNESKVKKVIVYGVINDSAGPPKIKAIFRYIAEVDLIKKQRNTLVQQMNSGNIKLLKTTKRNIESTDSHFGTLKNYYFKDVAEYFLERDKRVEKIKKLNRDNFLVLIPAASKYSAWIKQNNLNFKQESDVTNFLDYYNKKNLESTDKLE